MSISKLKSNLLDEKHKLYEMLSENPPSWWEIIKKDPELYVEIRKNNIIDVYYRGGRVAEIKMTAKGKLQLKAHPKYLGQFDNNNPEYYKKRIKDNKVYYDPIYSDCSEWIMGNMDEFKDNIRKYYAGEENGENTSEKLIQGRLIIENRDKHLDSEFAHRYDDDSIKTIRIDLVKIENNNITFVELKRIVDSRLRTQNGDPEILGQMGDYKRFLEFNANNLLTYYKSLYKIKKKLGLPIPHVEEVENLSIDTVPQLIINQNYDKMLCYSPKFDRV